MVTDTTNGAPTADSQPGENGPTWRRKLRGFIEDDRFQKFITGLILLNAATLGLETAPELLGGFTNVLTMLDSVILAVFVVEIIVRIIAYGWRFFRDPWSIFDFIIVGIALIPSSGALSVLRALRILRALRLISTVPQMRSVVQALLVAIPGMGSIVALMVLLFYVGAVIATKLYGGSFPQWFGTIGESMYSLFQIMTLESWSMGIVRPVLEVHPTAWLFFVPFILVATFTMLNLFIAVIVNAMQSEHMADFDKEKVAAHTEREEMLAEIRATRREIEILRSEIGSIAGKS
jgi:voltage-gated sodium channel